MQNPQYIQLNRIEFAGLEFQITVAELQKEIPFAIKRVYWLKSAQHGIERGNHAHVNSQQILVALNGSIKIKITNKAQQSAFYSLQDDDQGLLVPPLHWLQIEMPENSLLLCISSHNFDEQETVYDFNEFIGRP